MIKVKKAIQFLYGLLIAIISFNLQANDFEKICDSFDGKSIAGALIEDTSLIGKSDSAPEYCEIIGLIKPKLNFELRLPTTWNGKFHYSGGGGFNGFITEADESALMQGYADVASDSGHTGSFFSVSAFDASFALNDEHAFKFFASESVPTVTTTAKEITQQYYGKPISRTYFEGCSNGGREGLTAALKNPNLFDGIIARAPARQFVASYPFSQRNYTLLAKEGARINSTQLQLVSDKVLEHCDTVAADGIKDGIISNIDACDFDSKILLCSDGDDSNDDCLTKAQLAVVDSYTSPVISAKGQISYPGFTLHGHEADTFQWDIWLYGIPMKMPILPGLGNFFMNTGVQNIVANDDSIVALTWNFETEKNALKAQQVSEKLDLTNPDLSEFAELGGKLILWHGSTDVAVPLESTTIYYNGIVDSMGGREQADKFTRYYIAPGVNHCFGGVGADQQTQLLGALDEWVMQNKAPETLIANKTDDPEITRPLCVYPSYSHYTGSGDRNRAENYSCKVH